MSLRNRPEYIADVLDPIVYGATGTGTPQEVGLVNRIPLDKPIWGLLLDTRYRVVTTGSMTAVNAEGAVNFLQRVRVVGTHKRFGTRELVNLTGATLFELEKKYCFGIAPPISNSPTGVNLAAGAGTYDVQFVLPVPLVPRGIPKLQQMLFLVRNDEWATFDLYLTFGDITAIGNVAPTTAAFSDAGGGGSPRVRVSVIRSILGEARGLIQPAILRRQFLPLTTVLTSANLTDSPLQDLDVGFKVMSYLIKVGSTAGLTSTAGIKAFSSLVDTIVTRAKIKLDNVAIKDAVDPITARTYSLLESGFGGTYGAAPGVQATNPNPDQGYMFLEFCEGHDINTAFRGDMLNRSNKLQLAGDVTISATGLGEIVEEILEGEPNLYTPSSSGG
jgi:hypothetical protein